MTLLVAEKRIIKPINNPLKKPKHILARWHPGYSQKRIALFHRQVNDSCSELRTLASSISKPFYIMDPIINKAYDAESFRRLGHQLIDQLADHLSQSNHGEMERTFHWVDPDENVRNWEKDWEAQTNLTDVFQKLIHESVNLHHPHYMGHQIGPPIPASVLGSLVCDFLNNGMGVYEMGVHSSALERLVIRMVAAQMGLSASTDGFLTAGGTLANLTAMLAARSNNSSNLVWEQGAKQPQALMVSAQAHYCVDRAARIMGWGSAGIIMVPVNEQYEMEVSQLLPLYTSAQERGIEVIAVVGSACSTSTGSFDDLEGIADFCEEFGLWFHVDGAHGAPMALSQKYRHLVHGIERADSIAMDFHKSLAIPATTTALFFKNGALSFRTFQQKADYLFKEAELEWYNMAKRTFECTKLMMSVKIYSALKQEGFAFWDAYVTQLVDLGHLFGEMIMNHHQFELALAPACNIVCFRFKANHLNTSEMNDVNEHIRAAIISDGAFYMVKTKLQDIVWLRCTFTNPFTERKHMEHLLDQITAIGRTYLTNKKADLLQ